MTTQSLAAVKAHFSQVIDEVAGTHERVTVTRNGSPLAVILAGTPRGLTRLDDAWLRPASPSTVPG